jgi:hypothetical protein
MGTMFDDMTIEDMERVGKGGAGALINDGHVVGFDIEEFAGEETKK